MNCTNCGTPLNDNAEFCENCGTPITPFEEKPVFQAPAPVEEKKPFDKNSLPPEYRPLGAWAYFGLSLLFSIPIVGFVFLIVFSISKGNINRRNYARSHWCALIVSAALILIMAILVYTLGISTGALERMLSEFMY